ALIKFTVNGVEVTPSPSSVTNGTSPQVFNFAIPTSGFTFPTQACTVGTVVGVQQLAMQVPVIFNNTTTSCTAASTVTVTPANTSCVIPPPPQAVVESPAVTSCPGASAGAVAVGSSGTATITFNNAAATGSQNLVVTRGTNTGTNPADFAITPASQTIPPGGSAS